MASKRFFMGPEGSSAARMPRPGAPMATAVLLSSARFIAASSHCSSVIPDFAVPRRDWQRVRDRRFGSALMSLSSGAQHLDTRQGLALEPFEEGAAGGRDIGEALGHAGAV